MPERLQEIYTNVTHAISKMKKDRVSLPRAAREFGVSRLQMKRLGGAALCKRRNGRYYSKVREPLLRVMRILTPQGVTEIAVTNSGQASLLGEYWNVVQHYLATGDVSLLAGFRGKQIADADGNEFPLLTETEELDRLGSAGVLSFESLYARTG
jgi:hypothetical protein